MAKVRLVRGDLGWFPADVYLISAHEKGVPFPFGAARNVIDALAERFPLVAAPEGILHHVSEEQRRTALQGGEAHRIPRPADAPGDLPDLVSLACIPPRDQDAAPLVRVAVEEALTLATRDRDHPATVAMPAVGTGGAKLRFRVAAGATAKAVEAWLDSPDARDHELVLVIWQAHAYRTYLRIFHQRGLLTPDSTACLSSSLDRSALAAELRDCLTDQRSILFVGSGLSYNAVPPKPAWSELFHDEWLPPRARGGATTDPATLDYPKLAQMVADTQGRATLERRFLEQTAPPSLPSLTHLQLLSLPWSAILTTNYDDLLERSLRLLRMPFTLVTHEDQIANLDSARGIPLVKLHGGFCREGCEHPTRHHQVDGRLATRLIATQDDYDAFFDENPAMAAFLESRLLTSRGLIVGYSITDPHLQRLFARIGGVSPRVHRPRLFCLTETPSEVDDYWRHRGLVPVLMREPEQPESCSARHRDILDELVTDAELHLEENSVPNDLMGPSAWARLLEKSTLRHSPGKVAALVAALVEAGAGPPPPRIFERFAGVDRLRELADLHLSPARRARLARAWEQKPGATDEVEEDEP